MIECADDEVEAIKEVTASKVGIRPQGNAPILEYSLWEHSCTRWRSVELEIQLYLQNLTVLTGLVQRVSWPRMQLHPQAHLPRIQMNFRFIEYL